MHERDSARDLARLRADVRAGRISRREFMQGAAALGASLYSALEWSAAAVAEPKKGGQLRVGLDDGNTTDSMDPATYASRFMISMAHTRCNFLTEIDATNQVTGELAEDWDVSPDAKTWTLKLRKGVEFHNGKTFEAGDAAASLNHHRGDGSKSGAKALLESVTDIRAEDKHTLVIELERVVPICLTC